MAANELDYEQLPGAVKNNLTASQWEEALHLVVADGAAAPETTVYLNLKNGQLHRYEAGVPVSGPVLAAHNLAGGRGNDSAQFHTAPAGAPPGT
jgi:hypothetical protein